MINCGCRENPAAVLYKKIIVVHVFCTTQQLIIKHLIYMDLYSNVQMSSSSL